MIESSKNNRENYPRKCFWTQEKETRVKRPSAFKQLGPGEYYDNNTDNPSCVTGTKKKGEGLKI